MSRHRPRRLFARPLLVAGGAVAGSLFGASSFSGCNQIISNPFFEVADLAPRLVDTGNPFFDLAPFDIGNPLDVAQSDQPPSPMDAGKPVDLGPPDQPPPIDTGNRFD